MSAALIEAIVAPAGIFGPVINCPTTNPTVAPAETVTVGLLRTVVEPARTAEGTTLVMVEPAGMFVPATTMPAARPAVLVTVTEELPTVVCKPAKETWAE